MFYILNFGDHSFKSVDFASDVRKYLKKIQGKVAPDNIEIINAWGDETRYSVEEFFEAFPAADAVLDDDPVTAGPENNSTCKNTSAAIIVVDGIIADVLASDPNMTVTIVDFDSESGDREKLNQAWDEASSEMTSISCCIDHCEEEG